MVATSASHIIFFIASVIIAGAVVGVFYVAVSDFASAMDENSRVLAGNMRSDVRFINQPDMVPYVVYDNNITFYVMNTGKSTLNWNKTWVYLSVNGSYREVLDTQLYGNYSRWDPGVVLVVIANVTYLEKDITYTAMIEVRDKDSNGRATSSMDFKIFEKSYYFRVSGITDPMTAGSTSNVTVTVYDAYDKIYTGYRGKIHFSSSDKGASTILPGDYQFTETEASDAAGFHTFVNGIKLTTAGEQTVSVNDVANISVTGKQTGITVNPAAFAKVKFSANSPYTTTTGVPTSPYTIIAMDAYDNANQTLSTIDNITVTLTTIPVSATGQFRTTIGGLPVTTVTILNNGDGTASFYYYNTTPGTYTIRATPAGGSRDERQLVVYP
jgi:archaellum component FlaG (FlaF/FlaG flagellin family)